MYLHQSSCNSLTKQRMEHEHPASSSLYQERKSLSMVFLLESQMMYRLNKKKKKNKNKNNLSNNSNPFPDGNNNPRHFCDDLRCQAICFYQNQVSFWPLFASLCIVPLWTVSCLHAFPYSGFCSRCSRKISESLQTQVLWAWHVWVRRNIRIASLPSCSSLLSHGSVSSLAPAA